jgi:hypothetical protein
MVLIALHFWPHSASAAGVVQLQGRTGQNEQFRLALAEGRAVWLRTDALTYCGGGPWHITWSPSDGALVSFQQARGRLHVQEVHRETYADGRTSRVVSTLDGAVSRGHASGTLRVTATLANPGDTCDSGPIQWEASR